MSHSPCSRGFTLIELIVAIAVAAILITIAVPSLQETIKRNQVVSQNNELIALIHLSRNEAIRRNPIGNQNVRLELSADGTVPSWEAFVRPPGDTETAEGCPVGAIRCADHRRVALSSNSGMLVRFDNRGYSVDGNGNPQEVRLTLIHSQCESNRHAMEVLILPTGQVTSDARECTK